MPRSAVAIARFARRALSPLFVLPVGLLACASVPAARADAAPTKKAVAARVEESSFHGGPAHTGVYASPGPRTLKGARWSFSTKGRVLSSPVIRDGTLFVGSDDAQLYALDARTGTLRWKLATHGPVTSSPAVAEGRVFVVSADGHLYAADAGSGAVAWTFAHPGERRFEAKGMHGMQPPGQTMPDPFDYFLSSPTVVNGTVYFGSGDGTVYALDAAAGTLKWKFETGDVVHSSPAVADGTVFVGSWDTHLYALDAVTGHEKWRFKTGEDLENHNQVGIQSSPAVADGVVYFGCRDGHLYAVDQRTGQKKWDLNTEGSWVIGTPAVSAGSVYVGTSDTKLFFGLDAATGKKRFTTKLKGLVFSSAALASGLAYVGAFDGRVVALDTTDGAMAWSFATDGARRDERKILTAEGTVDPHLFTSPFFFDVAAAVDRSLSAGAVLSSPVVSDGMVYFGSADGNVYALEGEP